MPQFATPASKISDLVAISNVTVAGLIGAVRRWRLRIPMPAQIAYALKFAPNQADWHLILAGTSNQPLSGACYRLSSVMSGRRSRVEPDFSVRHEPSNRR
ncbi:MAG: hypothetical protein ACFB0G_00705 [Leptolyngbyaceae cyanobacterium]